MAFIPKDACWYIAQIILEINVEGESQNVVHVNYLLVRGESPEEAYEKALRLGNAHTTTYLNQHKRKVRIGFRGLRDLNVVYESLSDGAELLYEEKVGIDDHALSGMICSKESLAVFQPIAATPRPDYGSDEIRREANNLVEEK